ncbi:hypothetical protein FB446DRAFT_709651 [Lentinula raphanica]|nr:hypothetical protein FB446DRAFT_709651 [Lentinula raphanica]
MFFYPLKHQLAIVFASLFIFGSISVTSSAAIPASENGLVRACPLPEISTIVSFPADDIPNAYPLILDPKDVVVLQGLLLEKIATDIKYLLNKPELSTIKGENLGLAEGSQLRLYRKPSDLRRYILPYSVKVGDKEYNGMTLQMWNVDKDGKPVTPKAQLFRKPYIISYMKEIPRLRMYMFVFLPKASVISFCVLCGWATVFHVAQRGLLFTYLYQLRLSIRISSSVDFFLC